MSDYCYRHGEAWLSSRTTGGEPDNFDILLPEIDTLNLSFSSEKIVHRSKRQSVAAKDVSAVSFLDATGQLVISQYSANILKTALYGNTGEIAGGAFVAANAIFPSGIAVGDIMPIPGGRTHISSLVIVDSTGSPVTLTLGTHYEIVDANAGLVKFLDVTTGSVVQPFKASGNEAAGTGIGIFTQRVFELWLRFKGINILNNDAVEVLDLYKVQINPTSEFAIMGDGTDVNKVTLDFDLLKDSTKALSATFGQYGRLRQ